MEFERMKTTKSFVLKVCFELFFCMFEVPPFLVHKGHTFFVDCPNSLVSELSMIDS